MPRHSSRLAGVAACVLLLPSSVLALVARTAGDICNPAAPRCEIALDVEVEPGGILDFGDQEVEIRPGARVVAADGMTIRAARVTVDGGLLATPGGLLTVEATSGDVSVLVNVAGRRTAVGRVDVGSGRAILDAAGRVFVQGVVSADGGTTDGGSIEIQGTGVLLTGTVQATGGTRYDGGQIDISSGADLTITGTLQVDGAFGGAVTALAGGRVNFAGSVTARGLGSPGGEGGSVEIEARGAVRLDGSIDLRGADAGVGGTLDVLAGESLTVNGRCDLSAAAPGVGGLLEFSAGQDLQFTSAAVLDVSGSGSKGEGGNVILSAAREMVLGTVIASGEEIAGIVDATAWCRLTLPAGRSVRARGPGAVRPEIVLSASDAITVGGELRSRFGIALQHRPGGLVTILPSAAVSPSPVISVSESLVPCGGPIVEGCGNGRLEDGETCDDGNVESCDGCSAACRLEACGNGVVDCGENCDDGNTRPCDGCSADCGRPDAVCGDGIRECDEEADDGNPIPCDGVADDCRIERCGNGRRECGEACDDGVAGSAACSPACEELSPTCGDGVRDAGEQCDDGNRTECDGCSSHCLLERAGNGIVECGEACDDGNALPCDGCTADGRLETCGNGVIDCGEECDDGALNGTGDSDCLPGRCRRGELCTPASEGPCIPCAGPRDCGPTGSCGGHRCVAGVCDLGPPLSCDDGDACTDDLCDPARGCASTPRACDDGDPCSEDACDPLRGCVSVPRSCDDGDPCTADSCAADGRCGHERLGGAAGLACLLGGLNARIAGTDGDGLGKKTRKKLLRVVRAMEARRSGLLAASPGKAARAARAIEKLRRRAVELLGRARDIQPAVRDVLLELLGPRMPRLP